MSPIAHLQYGWWFAHWGKFSRSERAAIALAGAGPDLDGLSLLGGHEAFYRYHHILFHNVGAVLGVAVLTGLFLWRRMYVWLLVVFSFGMHIVEDYFTVSWNHYPWRPFASSAVNFASHMPGWVVQGVLQSAAMCFILWITIRIYLRHHRTPLEILSPAFDRLLLNYAVLPWSHRCSRCGRRAHFRCDGCGGTICSAHGRLGSTLRVECDACRISQV